MTPSRAAGAFVLRLQALKLRLANGRARALFVPLVEVVEVWMTEGLRSVATRSAVRLGWVRPPSRLPPEVLRPPSPRARVAFQPMTSLHGVSIVVPVFNNEALTRGCLHAIQDRTPAGLYEVIVVDNASTDRTPEMLDAVDGVRVIRNPTNAGFVEACNQGVEAAAGAFVLFLNNDTLVLDGWLEALVDTLARDPSIGAVGAQLIYPDDRLQEAGGIIWRDGTGWNYGKGDDRNKPEYNFVRDVDYCSAACLLVRRPLLQALGGLDRRYTPAYYEDTDLCFELRRLGYRVVYQPRAKVVHVEGATSGVDLASGYKQFQAVNRAAFVEKHRGALALQHAPDPRNVFRARHHGPGTRILVVDHMVPRPDRDSGSVRMYAILEILRDLGHVVTFIPDNLAAFEPYTQALRQMGVEILHGPMSIPRYLEDHLLDFDVVILCRLNFALKYQPAILQAGRRPRVVFDTVDLHFLRQQRRAELENTPEQTALSKTSRQGELQLARTADQVWVTSRHERDILVEAEPDLNIEVIPNIHRVCSEVPPFSGRDGLLFVGSFLHPPNEDAVVSFCRDILPLIRRRLPDVHLTVVGQHPPASVLALQSDHVLVSGHVADLTPILDACRVMVTPLRYGAGLKGKVGQSLAHGLPLVTTSIGAEGMFLEHRRHALVVDDVQAFADGVCELYSDRLLWERLSGEGRSHVDRYFGYDAATNAIRAALAGLLSRPSGLHGPIVRT